MKPPVYAAHVCDMPGCPRSSCVLILARNWSAERPVVLNFTCDDPSHVEQREQFLVRKIHAMTPWGKTITKRLPVPHEAEFTEQQIMGMAP